jgi:hypothetical protein
MYDRDATTTYAEARRWRQEQEATRRRVAAELMEAGNRRASCPRCKRAWPDPCVDRDANGQRVELDICHSVRAQRRLQGW